MNLDPKKIKTLRLLTLMAYLVELKKDGLLINDYPKVVLQMVKDMNQLGDELMK